MNVLQQARKAVFGETWLLPILTAALMGVAVALKALAPGAWDDAGGFVLLAGAVAILVALTRLR